MDSKSNIPKDRYHGRSPEYRRMQRARGLATLVIFSGTDGAGKSTQIELLSSRIEQAGKHVLRIWARGGYTPLFRFMKHIYRRFAGSELNRAGPSEERTRKFQSRLVRRVWLSIAILDLTLFYSVWMRLARIGSDYILCDRYIEDTLLDFQRNFPQEDVSRWLLWRLLTWSAPQPDHRFLFIVPPDVSERRSRQKNEPYPDSSETLEWRYSRYTGMSESGCWCVIDGRDPLELINARIVSELGLCESATF